MGREIINNLITSGKQGKPWFYRYVVLSGQLIAGLFLYNQMKKEELDFDVPKSIDEINAFFQDISAHCGESYAPAFALDAAELKVIPEDELARLVTTLVTAHQQQLLNYQDLPQVFMDLLVGTKYHPVSVPDDLIELMIGLAGSKREDSVYCPFNSSFSLALAAAEKSPSIYIELELVSILPIICNILRSGALKTVQGNPITNPSWTEPGHLKSFNVGLAFPPLDARYQKDELNDLS